MIRVCNQFLKRIHRDQSGSISVTSVFTFMFLTMVLGMVINIGRHADRKVKLQNAADAAAFTGSSVVARSMNTLSFTNHLLCDVFAVTAYLREARDQNSRELYPQILEKWQEIAPKFRNAPEPKFSRLAQGIPIKVPAEDAFVKMFLEQNAAISEQLLPVVEEILAEEMIPEFQRALVPITPQLANEAANEIANRHGPRSSGLNQGNEIVAVMWRTDAQPFGYATTDGLPQLPAADPVNDSTSYQQYYFDTAVRERERAARYYLEVLNNRMFRRVDGSICRYGENGVAKMSQFGNLWRGFTRAYLRQLLEEEYPDSNLVYQIRKESFELTDPNWYIEKDYMYIGVVYEKQMEEHMPGLFTNPLNADSVAFAQCNMDIPRRRVMEDLWEEDPEYRFKRVGNSTVRTLMNQMWTINLVPATSEVIPTVLLSNPPMADVDTPNIRGLSVDEFRRLNHH